MKSFSFDAKRQVHRDKFKASSAAERQFYASLKKVARVSGKIVESHVIGASLSDVQAMKKALESYSKMIGPWATRQSTKMLEKVSRSNKTAYKKNSITMAKAMRENVAERAIGAEAMRLLNEQVKLIQSIPIDAGLRAQDIAAKNFLEGRRAVPDESVVRQLEEEMGMSTEVAINRAKLIARTETAKANSAFVETRAKAVGSKGYIWRTTMDGAERKSHREMNGQFVEYDSPPTLSDGMTGHAGQFPNCRCYQEPVLPDDY